MACKSKRVSFYLSVLLTAVMALPGLASAQDVQDVYFMDLSDLNGQLAEHGLAIWKVEFVAEPGSGELGGTVYAKDVGNKRMDSHWVPGDPNRFGVNYISYAVDQVDGYTQSGLDNAATEAAIDASMVTWDNQNCTSMQVVKHLWPSLDLGYVQWLFGMGGVPGWGADITHAGWMPWGFFEALMPGGGNRILGVTFTFIWIDSSGAPTDLDNNGYFDTAFREIYYNDAFYWSVDGPGPWTNMFDVETVSLHEAGHGFSQGHFGKVFRDAGGQKLHFAPEAVMNAVVFGTKRELLGTDNGGFCTIWGSWPE